MRRTPRRCQTAALRFAWRESTPLDSSYGSVGRMARKQVIVQLDDALLAELDRAAEDRKVSRSEILRRAARLYLDAADEAEKERQMVEAYRRTPEDPAETGAITRLAVENWPEW